MEKLTNKILASLEPKIYPKIEVKEINKKKMIVIEVEEAKEKPVFAFGRGFKRVGKSTIRMSREEIEKLILEREKIYWDEQICKEASLQDIDEEKLDWYLERRKKIRKIPSKFDTKTLLTNIGVAKKANHKIKITNAGILFFGKTPQRFIQTRIIGARFKGKQLSRTTTDSIDCSGTIWEMLEQAEDFIRKNINLYGFRTGLSFRRTDKLEYPMDAIREGIINALIHRGYSELTDIRIFIFDDRIEIINPGSFPEGVTPKKPIHKPRNPILCQLMRDVGFVEKYGSGIYFMKDLCREWGIPEPEFEISKLETKLIFRSAGESIIVSEMEKLGVELNERQEKALKSVAHRKKITNKDYQEINKVSRITASRELMDLVKIGILKQKGRGRGSYFILNV